MSCTVSQWASSPMCHISFRSKLFAQCVVTCRMLVRQTSILICVKREGKTPYWSCGGSYYSLNWINARYYCEMRGRCDCETIKTTTLLHDASKNRKQETTNNARLFSSTRYNLTWRYLKLPHEAACEKVLLWLYRHGRCENDKITVTIVVPYTAWSVTIFTNNRLPHLKLMTQPRTAMLLNNYQPVIPRKQLFPWVFMFIRGGSTLPVNFSYWPKCSSHEMCMKMKNLDIAVISEII